MPSNLRSPELPEWLREFYPFETHTFDLSGETMSFIDEGPRHGPTFVLVHGSPVWSMLWRDAIARMRDTARVIAPDLVGFGLSSKPADPAYHTLDRHIENLTSFLTSVAPARFTLVLHGSAGPIGLAYATAYPDRVERLVLVNTWGTIVPNIDPKKASVLRGHGIMGRLFGNSPVQNVVLAQVATKLDDMTIEGYKFPFQDAPEIAVQVFTEMLFHPDNATTARMQQIETGLKKITAKAEILHGLKDRALTRLPAYLLRDALKSSREPVFVENASHLLPEDAPDALYEMLVRQEIAQAEAAGDALFRILT
jgi:cis-3-alkyl-4-acyloxetan-2-one decarboxylase